MLRYTVLFIFIALAGFHLVLSGSFTLPLLMGERSVALFDLWSLQHLCTGMLLGAVFVRLRPTFTTDSGTPFVYWIILLGLLWEALELAMEVGCLGPAIAEWKHGFEHWSNRFFGDLCLWTTGSLIGAHYPFVWKWVLVPVAAWFFLNITSPTAMSVQQRLLGWLQIVWS